ncbi:MAG TPA: NAD(P)H-binding protein [Thermoanaerobaculia bacterium]|jgi:uncharacterized protein YbjT (DUF2867 family)
MRVLLFGATGMVGQGVLRECLLDPDVSEVVAVGRSPAGVTHAKLRDVVVPNVSELSEYESKLSGFDACFFCLGVSSVGMSEADYRRVTYDLTLAVAATLARLNPTMVFVYVSGAGTDSTERGRSMWARVKGATENALLRLPFRAVMFRPGFIAPLHGIRSKTPLYRFFYALARPLTPLLRAAFPRHVTTSERVGRAMLRAAKEGAPKRILEMEDF